MVLHLILQRLITVKNDHPAGDNVSGCPLHAIIAYILLVSQAALHIKAGPLGDFIKVMDIPALSCQDAVPTRIYSGSTLLVLVSEIRGESKTGHHIVRKGLKPYASHGSPQFDSVQLFHISFPIQVREQGRAVLIPATKESRLIRNSAKETDKSFSFLHQRIITTKKRYNYQQFILSSLADKKSIRKI